MINKKMLVIGSYPIKDARHGGQKRLEAIFEYYRTFIKEVRFSAVFHKATYPQFEVTDICLGQKDILDEIDKDPQYYELIIGEAPNRDIHTRSHMAQLLLEYQPDIIHIEQPYLYAGMKVLLQELGMRPFLIFGSENIEAPLKDEILQHSHYGAKKRKDIVSRVDGIERMFTREADLVVAVSKSDALIHKSMGAKKCVVASNGIKKNITNHTTQKYWSRYKKAEGLDKTVVFIGSGHPPNYKGFLELIGNDSSFLRDGAKFIIAGGVGEYFKITYKEKRAHLRFWEKVNAVGFLKEDQLTGLIDTADLIILPIISGGGSNLKTAEAILSGKKIVATSFAFRGFEEYLSLPNIYIADAPDDFKMAINKALDEPYIHRSRREVSLAERVQWSYSLGPIRPAIRYLLKVHDIVLGYSYIRGRLARIKRRLLFAVKK